LNIDELKAFIKEFEKENPEISKQLSEEMLPEPQRKALIVERAIRELNSQVKQNPSDKELKKELGKLITNVAKDKQLMKSLEEHAPGLTAQIKVKAKQLKQYKGNIKK
jgi:uncharacterized protein YneF (UPF0154 family)